MSTCKGSYAFTSSTVWVLLTSVTRMEIVEGAMQEGDKMSEEKSKCFKLNDPLAQSMTQRHPTPRFVVDKVLWMQHLALIYILPMPLEIAEV
eukprot:14110701-Ditylum_brightwellii.AAC.1